MSGAIVNLSGLTYRDLKQHIKDRLFGEVAGGVPIDTRGDEPVYQWLVDSFRQGSDGLQNRMTEAFKELLFEALSTSEWNESIYQLLDLLQLVGKELISEIYQRLTGPEIGDSDVRAGLLKVFVAHQHKGTEAFWLNQYNLLGPEYGALVFAGLVEHGLDTAVAHFPQLAKNDHALAWLELYIPSLIDRFGLEATKTAFHLLWDQMNDAQKKALKDQIGVPVHHRTKSGNIIIPQEDELAPTEVEFLVERN